MSKVFRTPGEPGWPGQRKQILTAAEGGTVIWDFDGVIADTEPVHAQSYRILLERRGYEPEDNFFLRLIGNPETRIWDMLREPGVPVPEDTQELIAERRDVFLEMALAELQPSWIVTDLAARLADVANRQIIVSNGDRRTISRLLQTWNLDVYIGWPPPIDGGRLKPGFGGDKTSLLHTLMQEGPTVVFEDNAGYLTQAREGGSYCVGVRHGMSPSDGIRGDVNVEI